MCEEAAVRLRSLAIPRTSEVEVKKLRETPGMPIILSQRVLKLKLLAEELLCPRLLLRGSQDASVQVFRLAHEQAVD
jgi:hypothetical protein